MLAKALARACIVVLFVHPLRIQLTKFQALSEFGNARLFGLEDEPILNPSSAVAKVLTVHWWKVKLVLCPNQKACGCTRLHSMVEILEILVN